MTERRKPTFAIKGWCPGALRPMLSGDGYVVRVRPRSGSLRPDEAAGLARAARAFGNGLIELTARANVQLRGVSPETHGALIAALTELGLVDPDIGAETRRNIVVTPFRLGATGDETVRLAAALDTALRAGPDLPGKFGFAIDTGEARLLADISADIRFERTAGGRMIVRPDGADFGREVTAETAAAVALDLASWFIASGGITDGRGRMARHLATGALLPEPASWTTAPAPAQSAPRPGPVTEGMLIAAAFGQLEAEALAALADLGADLRVTPWRMLLVTGRTALPAIPGLIVLPDDPLLAVTACPGAPACAQAHRPTRALARAVAPHVPAGRHLHVTGCAKGCAHPLPADSTLVATADGFSLVRHGRATDVPSVRGLSEAAVLAAPAALFETCR